MARIIRIRVVPRSSRNAVIGEMADGGLKVKLTAPPVEGAANEALTRVLSRHFGVARESVRIVSGARGRIKLVEIDD